MSEKQKQIEARLAATGLMSDDLELTLNGWSLSMLFEAASQTAQVALGTLVESNPDPLDAITASVNVAAIVDHFVNPFMEQCAPLPEDGSTPMTFTLPVAAATAFGSLVMMCIVTNDLHRPDRPEPTSPGAMVSNQEILWWAVIRMFNQFPAPVLEILTEETGLNFEEIQ